MKKILLILTLFSQFCIAQDTTYFDSDWKQATPENATFFRIEKKDGSKWTRLDYYFKTNQLQMKGAYSSLAPETEEGNFEWYHPNGKLKHKGEYDNGKKTGEIT